MSDVKLRIDAAGCYVYPDVLVTCSAADTADRLVKREPLLVEVLSPSAAAYDRGDTFADDRRVASLREHLLVDSRTRRCDLYRRGADGLWTLHPSDAGQPLTLASVELTIVAATLRDEVPPPDEDRPVEAAPAG